MRKKLMRSLWDCGDALLFDSTHDDGRCGVFDAIYVHDKRETGKEEGEQKQASSSSGVFLLSLRNDAMIPPLAVYVHMSLRFRSSEVPVAGNYFYGFCA
jgi:hypothetical protein